MEYELIIIWDTGEKTITDCRTYEEAKKVEYEMKKCFGGQLSWTGIRDKRN